MPEERTDADDWVETHARDLYRIAAQRLETVETAEDAVQETLLAALRSQRSFRGDSSERTWLVGILKHKIADHYRGEERRPREIWSGEFEGYFDVKGRWLDPPKSFAIDEVDLVENDEFLVRVRDCLGDLPPRQASAFVSRVLDEEEPENICNRMSISTTNFWVLVHRARLGLRACLERNWFLSGEAGE